MNNSTVPIDLHVTFSRRSIMVCILKIFRGSGVAAAAARPRQAAHRGRSGGPPPADRRAEYGHRRARARARAEMGKVDESFQDICEAERLEPSNKVIRRYRIRLQQEAERSGIHLIPQRHTAMIRNPNFGSQESLGGLSVASGATVREPPVPPPRIKSNPTGMSTPGFKYQFFFRLPSTTGPSTAKSNASYKSLLLICFL